MNIQIGTTRKLAFVLLDTNGDEITGLGSTFSVTYSKNGGVITAGSGTKAEVGSGIYTYTQTTDETDTAGPLLYEIVGAGTDVQRLLHEVVGYAPAIPAGANILTTTEAATVLRCEVDDPDMLALLSIVDAIIKRGSRDWTTDTTINPLAKHAARIAMKLLHEDPGMSDTEMRVMSLGFDAAMSLLEAEALYYRIFEGLDGAGYITIDAAREGDTVISLVGKVGATGDQSAKFESVITVDGYIQQTSSDDLEDKWYEVKLLPPGEM